MKDEALLCMEYRNMLFRWKQNSVTTEAKFRYHGSKLPLVRKNDSFARPGPLPPGNVVPQRVAPSLALPCEIFPKKNRAARLRFR